MKLYKLFIATLLATAFTACADYEDVVVSSPVVGADVQAVRFASTNKTTFELDPSKELSVVLTVIRDKADAAAEIPVEVISNDDDNFVIPSTVSFAAGDSTTTLKVMASASAPIGEDMVFEVKLSDAQVNPYKVEYASYKAKVTILKWDLVGTGQFYDSFTLYSAPAIDIYYSEVKKQYRFANPYTVALLEEAEWENWIGGPTSEFIIFEITATGFVKWKSWYTGLNYKGNVGQPVEAFFPSYLGDIRGVTTYDAEDALSKVSETDSKLLILNPRIYILGVGGYGLKPCYISMPGGPNLTTLLEL